MAIQIEAIGRVAHLGELYDARYDEFQNYFLFDQIPQDVIMQSENNNTQLKYSSNNSLKNKFENLNLSAEIKMSVLSGIIKLEGSGKYFKDSKKSAKSSKVSLIQTIETVKEQISINSKALKSLRDIDVLTNINATHVVVGIQWGGLIFVSVEDQSLSEDKHKNVKGDIGGQAEKLVLHISGKASISKKEIEKINEFNFELYGDILPEVLPLTLFEAIDFLKIAPTLLKKANGGKGKAIKYFLSPLTPIRKLWNVEITSNILMKYIDESIIMTTVDIFDKINFIMQNLNDFYKDIKQNEFSLKKNEVDDIINIKNNFLLFQLRLQSSLAKQLISVRSGTGPVDDLVNLIRQSFEEPLMKLNFESTNYKFLRTKLSFINYMKKLGVVMINRSFNFDDCLRKYFEHNLYVLHFDFNNTDWSEQTIKQFTKLVLNKPVDCDKLIFAAIEFNINDSENPSEKENKICLYKNCNEIKNVSLSDETMIYSENSFLLTQSTGCKNVQEYGKQFVEEVECINILLIGRRQTGKSTLVQTLLDPFNGIRSSGYSDPSEPKLNNLILIDKNTNKLYQLNIIETPGLKQVLEKGQFKEDCKMKNQINYGIKLLHQLNMVCFVSRAGDMKQLDIETFGKVRQFLGDAFSQISMIVLTFCDEYSEKHLMSFQEDIKIDRLTKQFSEYCKLGTACIGAIDNNCIEKFGDLSDSVRKAKLTYIQKCRNNFLDKIIKCTQKKLLTLYWHP